MHIMSMVVVPEPRLVPPHPLAHHTQQQNTLAHHNTFRQRPANTRCQDEGAHEETYGGAQEGSTLTARTMGGLLLPRRLMKGCKRHLRT